jgi:hypothetical protein
MQQKCRIQGRKKLYDVVTTTTPPLKPKPGKWAETLAPEGVGERLYAFASAIYPICRSITGPGVRETLDLIDRIVPLQRSEVPTHAPPGRGFVGSGSLMPSRATSGSELPDGARGRRHIRSLCSPRARSRSRSL